MQVMIHDIKENDAYHNMRDHLIGKKADVIGRLQDNSDGSVNGCLRIDGRKRIFAAVVLSHV